MNNLKRIADLSMTIGFSKFVTGSMPVPKPLRKALNKLEKISISHIFDCGRITDDDSILICAKMIEHSDACQWIDREMPIQIYCLFVADIMAGYDYPDIHRQLLNVQDYFDRRQKTPDFCYKQAVEAAEKWERIWRC